jgi:hypothetical protein
VERCPYRHGGVASSRDETLNFFLDPRNSIPREQEQEREQEREQEQGTSQVFTSKSFLTRHQLSMFSFRCGSSHPVLSLRHSLRFPFLGFYGVLGTGVRLTAHPETFLFSLITCYRLTAKYVPLPRHSAHSCKLPATLTAMATAAKTLSRALPRSSATSSARLATHFASRPTIAQQFFRSSRRNYSSGPAPSSSSNTGLYIGAAAVAVAGEGRYRYTSNAAHEVPEVHLKKGSAGQS